MSDTGEKFYIATESTAQEILAAFDSLTITNTVDEIKSMLESGVECKTVYGGSSIVSGEISSGEQLSVTGSGIIYLMFDCNHNSQADLNFTIDGVSGTWTLPYTNPTSPYTLTLPFGESFVLTAEVVVEYTYILD